MTISEPPAKRTARFLARPLAKRGVYRRTSAHGCYTLGTLMGTLENRF
jgi:hypothetical protein